jgi:hypothetical protein
MTTRKSLSAAHKAAISASLRGRKNGVTLNRPAKANKMTASMRKRASATYSPPAAYRFPKGTRINKPAKVQATRRARRQDLRMAAGTRKSAGLNSIMDTGYSISSGGRNKKAPVVNVAKGRLGLARNTRLVTRTIKAKTAR